MRGAAWTNDRVDLLRQLWANGSTATVIAATLGISRSAVLGKVFRLRLGAAPIQTPQQRSSTNHATAMLDTAKSAASILDLGPASQQIAPARRRWGAKRGALQKVQGPPAIARGKSLFELTNTTCRWPHGRPGTGKFFFCGAPGADLERGMPYCTKHARRAYTNYSDAKGAVADSPHIKVRPRSPGAIPARWPMTANRLLKTAAKQERDDGFDHRQNAERFKRPWRRSIGTGPAAR